LCREIISMSDPVVCCDEMLNGVDFLCAGSVERLQVITYTLLIDCLRLF